MKYIIMCGGQYSWETPRQMTEIQGEPVVARTIFYHTCNIRRHLGMPPYEVFVCF